MKKVVLKLDLQEADEKRRALKTVATLSGIDEISIDSASKKLTLIGTVDPVSVVSKLRKKSWPTEIISVGPAKKPEKKEEPKKAEEAKKDETAAKKDEAPKKEDAKKENEKKLTTDHELVVSMPMASRLYYPPMNNFYYVHPGIEENPSACTIL